ncbi:DUF3319 domain-containing protein [Vibrio fortis]|uniref:DUF3319 domain-containing protein n=1 Tax=Vibrio fortis TaxID=212667 RepID=A0A066USV7_9VIBR|nr:DUF3319 domain-containing protein [Vibrio fortis]KAB0300662.1 DUF3319 domain-containing protein [Vibrio fortis]KDN27184.1 tail protein [Vibrio fortis]
MANSIYRGVHLQSTDATNTIWRAKLKNHAIQGNLTALKKSIDWWIDTASIIDPKEFTSLNKPRAGSGGQAENFNGYQIKNDTGEPNAWYCMFNGRLIKGSKMAIQRHIEAYLVAKQKAQQQQKK